jgi:hypothetical protein
VNELLIQICGWVGMALVIGAYYQVSAKKLDPAGRTYQLLNIIGSVGVGVNVFHQQAWPAVALQVVWGAIGIAALVRLKNKT